jgi:hypothetical protein
MIGSIYRVICKSDPSIIYIGSTTESLNSRWSKHKIHLQKWISGIVKMKCSIYPMMKEKGVNDFKIELIKNYEISDNNHLTAYEQLWINKTKCVNIVNPLHGYSCKFFQKYTNMKYGIVNRDIIKEKNHIYREANKDAINAKVRGKQKERYAKYGEKSKIYVQANKEHIKAYKAKLYQEKKVQLQARYKENYEKRKNVVKCCLCETTYDYGTKSSRDGHFNTIRHRELQQALITYLKTH